MKKENKQWRDVLIALILPFSVYIFFNMIFFPFGSLPKIFNKIDHWNDPCYVFDVGKGGKSIFQGENDYVCVNDMPARFCSKYNFGSFCINITIGVKGADLETLRVYHGSLMTDKDYVYVNGKRTKFDVDKFRYDKNGIFYVGDDKYFMFETKYKKVR